MNEFQRRTIGNTFREIIFSNRSELEKWKNTVEFRKRVKDINDVNYYLLQLVVVDIDLTTSIMNSLSKTAQRRIYAYKRDKYSDPNLIAKIFETRLIFSCLDKTKNGEYLIERFLEDDYQTKESEFRVDRRRKLTKLW